jgi:hypothetical protein
VMILNNCAAKREDEAGMKRWTFMARIFGGGDAPVKSWLRQK